MLDDVERRRFLVQPAGEGAPPFGVRALHIHLHEGAGQLLHLPRRRALTGAQAQNHIAHAKRLARLHRQVARDAVALVEQTDDRDAFRHRRLATDEGRVLGRGLAGR
jgi:hypothetical protein